MEDQGVDGNILKLIQRYRMGIYIQIDPKIQQERLFDLDYDALQ